MGIITHQGRKSWVRSWLCMCRPVSSCNRCRYMLGDRTLQSAGLASSSRRPSPSALLHSPSQSNFLLLTNMHHPCEHFLNKIFVRNRPWITLASISPNSIHQQGSRRKNKFFSMIINYYISHVVGQNSCVIKSTSVICCIHILV